MFKLESSFTQKHDKGCYTGAWGDRGDGTYNNPILAGDFSDPDIIRVGDDYFAVTSTMQLCPGLTVLHSTDLVNWEILGGAVGDLTEMHERYSYRIMKGYGCCIWAPCISYDRKNAMYYIHYGTPDDGIFAVKTSDPFSGWSSVCELKRRDGTPFGRGWDDCSVFWGDDGAYIVATCFADGYKGYLYRLSDDGTTLLDDGVLIHSSHDEYAPEEYAPEANKLFFKDGYYYFFHNGCRNIEGHTVRMAWMMRSTCIYGTHADGSNGTYTSPGKYEHIPYPIVEGFREPCQGNFVDADTPAGKKWYFFTHHGSTRADGRPCSLLPVEWEDGWPVVSDGETKGKMIWQGLPKPFPDSPVKRPDCSDDFSSAVLDKKWMWSFTPREDMYSLTERAGFLRLHAFRPLEAGRLETAGNTLLERNYRYEQNIATARFELDGMKNGQNAGLLHAAGRAFRGIGVRLDGEELTLRLVSSEKDEQIAKLSPSIHEIYFRSVWNFDFVNSFYYSTDGESFIPVGDEVTLHGGDYRGDAIGFYCFNDICDEGYIDIDYIKIESK